MKKTWAIFCAIIFIFFLAACSAAQNPSLNSAISTPVPTPSAGRSVITGKMIVNGSQPFADRLIRLSKIYGEGQEAIYVVNESTDPGAYTDAQGVFVFTDIEPGNYAVLFADGNGNYLTINESSEKILTVEAEESQIVDMGEIRFNLDSQ